MKLPKIYEPGQYEADIYALWEKSRAFVPRGTGEAYSIVIPPPNANGNIHVGTAFTLALEDIAARYHRLKGDRVLLLPGADHAGFETQVVYERQLAKEGKSRFDFSRDELYANIWDFVAQNREIFETQIRRVGTSADWSRYTFTLDEKIVKRAYATFKKLWDDGLVYRGERLINYCTFHGTAFADIEVEYKEEQGSLWYIRYPLTDGSGELTIATTRPETLFGDTAVAVHPDDKRHAKFIGKTVKLPLTNREIPVIADEFVEIAFGTGAVKITPAHDPNDFEVGQRHDLPMPSVITFEGTLTADVPEPFRGMEVSEARTAVVQALEDTGALVKTESYAHNVGHCYKCGTVIQPLLREQWFVDMQPLAQPAIKALEAGKIAFYPLAKRDQLVNYLKNLRDWNISRQIAWGIPIPAFQNVDNPDDWLFDERVDQEIVEVNGKTYRRDPDVFDTWFSSGSWPYATLNFGAKDDQDFQDFYPLGLMETGADILYPWVSRMLMLGLYNTGDIPFKTVYLHGLVLDEHGQKMSKSRGNVINPMDLIDEYGSDAVRMGLITGQTAGNNQPLGVPKIVGARNFCNKLWNIARYIEDKLGSQKHVGAPELKTIADHWIMSRLHACAAEVAAELEKYRFSEAYERLYHFVWDDFADWYIEASKAEPNTSVLATCLEAILAITHPFAPFLTETIWQTLAWAPDTVLAASRWPLAQPGDKKMARTFEDMQAIATEAREILKNVGAHAELLHTGVAEVADNAALIKQLSGVSAVREAGANPQGLKLAATSHDLWVGIDATAAKKYLARLEEKQLAERIGIERLEARLHDKRYVANAPEHVVAQTRQQLAEAQARLGVMEHERQRFADAA